MSFHWQPFVAVLLIAIVTSAGGLYIASKKPNWYQPVKLWRLVALGAGLMLGIAFLEFLPITFSKAPHDGPLWIIAGVIFILFMETVVSPKLHFLEGDSCNHDHAHDHAHKKHPEFEHQHHLISHQAACSAVGCLIICCFFDGFGITSAFEIGNETGWITGLGLFFHVLPDGVLAASIALAGGMSQKSAGKVALTTGGSLISGSMASFAFGQLAGVETVLIPFASGVLLYVAFIHLLPTGMKHPRGLWWVVTGLGFFAVLHALIEHSH